MSPTWRLRLVAVLAIGASLPLAAATHWGHPALWALPLLITLVAAANILRISITVARIRVTFTMTEGVLAGAFLLAPGWWIVPATCLGLFPALLRQRSSPLKVFYNLAQYFLTGTLAAYTAVHLHGGVVACAAAMAIWWMTDQVMSAIPLSIMGRQSLRAMIFEDAGVYAVHAAGTTSVGLLASWLMVHAPFGLLGLLVPVFLLWVAFDEQTSKSAEARLFAELARGQEQAVTHSVDISARVVLTAAARVLGGADVELVVLEHEGPVVYTGDESGQTQRRPDPHAFDQPWALRALGARGVLVGSEEGRPFCSAVIGKHDRPLAVMIARRAEGSSSFGRREVALVKVLVGQAKSWLSVADLAAARDRAMARAHAADQAARSLGDLGADTAPALDMLRESATRLARLASTGSNDAVREIVEELHAVERAVASLLGAIALAADPALRELDATPSAPVRREGEWTTTGLLPGTAKPDGVAPGIRLPEAAQSDNEQTQSVR